MDKSADKKTALSQLPSVDYLLNLAGEVRLPHFLKREVAREMLDRYRERIQNHGMKFPDVDAHYLQALEDVSQPLKKVINASGIILHTGLGRAPYSKETIDAFTLLKDSYINLELNLENGKRGNRQDHLRTWIRALSGAEDGILVNNNAAAVLLALNTLADRKEVIISRGQLVEIGGSFRIPEILKKAGSKLVEVGTTNRTHLMDYANAITGRTRLLLWVHTSNYRIKGFTNEVELHELVKLGQKHSIPVMADLGSGALTPIETFGLDREPMVSEIIKTGVQLCTFSVDKLIGGPQGGVIAGDKQLIRKIEKNNLLRALRPDKTQILLTLESFKAYDNTDRIQDQIPIYRDLDYDINDLKQRAETIMTSVDNDQIMMECIDSGAQVGSGASPVETLPSIALSIRHKKLKINTLSKKLREHTPAIIGRIKTDSLLLDLRTVREQEDPILIQALKSL